MRHTRGLHSNKLGQVRSSIETVHSSSNQLVLSNGALIEFLFGNVQRSALVHKSKSGLAGIP